MRTVLVLIVSYRSASDVVRCLTALGGSTYRNFRVAVCENGGQDAFVELLRLAPKALPYGQPVQLVMAPGNLGYAGGINHLLDASSPADAYWILNPDAVPEDETLLQMLARLDHGDCHAIGHDIFWTNGELASRGGKWRPLTAQAIGIGMRGDAQGAEAAYRVEAEMNYIVGASMLVSQAFLDRAGRMRSDYFLYCEEVEWCLRAIKRGMRLGYAADARVTHRHGTSTGGGGRLRDRSRVAVYLNERGRLLLTRDTYPGLIVLTAPLALASCIVRYGRGRAWRQLGYAVEGWAAGVRNERGVPAWLP